MHQSQHSSERLLELSLLNCCIHCMTVYALAFKWVCDPEQHGMLTERAYSKMLPDWPVHYYTSFVLSNYTNMRTGALWKVVHAVVWQCHRGYTDMKEKCVYVRTWWRGNECTAGPLSFPATMALWPGLSKSLLQGTNGSQLMGIASWLSLSECHMPAGDMAVTSPCSERL